MPFPPAVHLVFESGGLTVGGNAMQRHSGLPSSVILVIEALIVLLVLASDLLRSWRLVIA